MLFSRLPIRSRRDAAKKPQKLIQMSAVRYGQVLTAEDRDIFSKKWNPA